MGNSNPDDSKNINDRDQLFSNLFSRNMSDEFKKRVTGALTEIGARRVNTISYDLNSGADAQVFMRADLGLEYYSDIKAALDSGQLIQVATLSMATILEEVVLGIKPTVTNTTIRITNNMDKRVVGVLIYNKLADELEYLETKDEMALEGGKSIQIQIPQQHCKTKRSIILMISDATYAETPLSQACNPEFQFDLKKSTKYPINAADIKNQWLYAFYGLKSFDFTKTQGKFNNGTFSGKGWTKLHGDVTISDFVNGYRHGLAVMCLLQDTGHVLYRVIPYNMGNIIQDKSKVYPSSLFLRGTLNRDPQTLQPSTFDQLYTKYCN